MTATNAQVQRFLDERARVRCEQIRALISAMDSDKAVFDDIYTYLNGSNDFADMRTDVPIAATGSDILAFNSAVDILRTLKSTGEWNVVQKLCVQAPRV